MARDGGFDARLWGDASLGPYEKLVLVFLRQYWAQGGRDVSARIVAAGAGTCEATAARVLVRLLARGRVQISGKFKRRLEAVA